MNKAILRGNLAADPELRYTGTGKAVANFQMATNEVWNDANGNRQQRTEWHRIVAWGKQAEICAEYLNKGSSILLEGNIRTREWTDRNNVKRYTTEIYMDRVEFLGGKPSTQQVKAEQQVSEEVPEADVPSVEEDAQALYAQE